MSGVGGAFSLSPKQKVVPQVVPQVVLGGGLPVSGVRMSTPRGDGV